MKTTLLFLLLSFGAVAQSYTFKVEDFVNGNQGPMNGLPGDLFTSMITFSNSSNTAIKVFINRYQKNIAPFWSVCYCYIQCHSPNDDTVTVDIQPFSTNFVVLQFKTDSVNPGITTASFRMDQMNTSAITQTINMTASTMGPSGVPDIGDQVKVSLIPNPASTSLLIRNSSNIKSITVTDIMGSLKYRKAINSETIELDVSHYSIGIYFIEIDSDRTKTIHKFIKE